MLPVKIHPLTASEAVLALEGRHPTDDELKAYADIIMDAEHISNASTMRLITAVLDLRAALRGMCEAEANSLIHRACRCENDYEKGLYSFVCGLCRDPYHTKLHGRLTRFLMFQAIRRERQ